MKNSTRPLRLDPQTAGELHHQHALVSTELAYATRYRREFDRQLKELIGDEAILMLHNSTENTLLLADLVKEAA